MSTLTSTAVAALDAVTVTPGGRRRRVLDAVSLELLRGGVYLVHGPSGGGKTTLLNVLAGYVQPDGGEVTRAASTGYLFQDDTLFSALTARQNLQVKAALIPTSQAERTRAIDEVLASVGLGPRADEVVEVLSGGERQRLQLARLLLGRPDLVLLDEPTSSLDPDTRVEVATTIRRVFARTTLVVVSHDPALARDLDASDVLHLDRGRIRHG